MVLPLTLITVILLSCVQKWTMCPLINEAWTCDWVVFTRYKPWKSTTWQQQQQTDQMSSTDMSRATVVAVWWGGLNQQTVVCPALLWRDRPHCQAPPRFGRGGKWVVHVHVCLSSSILWAPWLGQAAPVAGLSQTCQCSVAHHCGSGRLMRRSNRKSEGNRETGRGGERTTRLNAVK